MNDTDPEYISGYISRLPLIQRIFFRLFRKAVRKLVMCCALTPYKRGRINSAAVHEVVGVLDTIYPSKK